MYQLFNLRYFIIYTQEKVFGRKRQATIQLQTHFSAS